ncbi:MAG: hypothetical protein ACE5J4_03090 [Candidatus Aenigmatarchaeota archaeon]
MLKQIARTIIGIFIVFLGISLAFFLFFVYPIETLLNIESIIFLVIMIIAVIVGGFVILYYEIKKSY